MCTTRKRVKRTTTIAPYTKLATGGFLLYATCISIKNVSNNKQISLDSALSAVILHHHFIDHHHIAQDGIKNAVLMMVAHRLYHRNNFKFTADFFVYLNQTDILNFMRHLINARECTLNCAMYTHQVPHTH